MIQKVTRIINNQRYGELSGSITDRSIYREFKDSKEAASWGMEHYQEWAKSYKATMRTAKRSINNSLVVSSIECYCGYSYRQINEYLRFGDTGEYSLYREMADILAIILSSAPRIPSDIVVYRLVCDDFIKELIENNKNKFQIPTQEKGFISTSLLTNIVNEKEPYANHSNLLKIYVNKNSIGIYVNAVTAKSEQEVLLFPKGFFRLIQYPYRDHEINKMIYECELFYFDF